MSQDAVGEYTGGLKSAEVEDIRYELCLYSARLKQRGLTSATGGNVSYRVGDDMWISPTGCVMDELEIDDWVKVNLSTGKPTHISSDRHRKSSCTARCSWRAPMYSRLCTATLHM